MSLSEQREQFKAAWSALERGEPWRALAEPLTDYYLRPELEIEHWRQQNRPPARAQADRMLSELSDHRSLRRLRQHWLRLAFEARDYPRVVRLSASGDNTASRCRTLFAEYQLGRRPDAAALAIYTRGRSQPKACDPLFAELKRRDLLTAGVIRLRKDAALTAGNLTLARYLAEQLGPKNQARVEGFALAGSDPEAYLAGGGEWTARALDRLSSQDPKAASAYWHKANRKQREYTVLHGILDDLPEVAGWLETVQPPYARGNLDTWVARYWLKQGDWRQALTALDALDSESKGEDVWRYWRAETLSRLGRTVEAQTAFTALSKRNSFYGFLAADRTGQPYQIPNAQPARAVITVDDLAPQKRLRIAEELFLTGLESRARSQWRWTLPQMGREQQRAAVARASALGWSSEMIRGAAVLGLPYLEYRYPAAFYPRVETQIAGRGTDPAWVMGLIRTESLFMPDVSSRAGALGLMQIMPDTGRRLANQLGESWQGSAMLLNPDVNLRFGVQYLNDMLGRFEQNQIMATAAYNAGPHRVDAWKPSGEVDPVLWIETIPFKETRNYVKKVMHAAVLFDWQQTGDIARLSARMSPIVTKD